ncbi:MAG: ABC transporter permease [Candidatus Pacearchaeota archaeon]|nr:MAG: ABC transporter permease [Candidatus Pacearchaeota archaeon]
MKFDDSLKFALNNLTTRGLRSWLTIIGVIIGVAAIVAIVSVGQGMQETISAELGSLGGDVVFVLAGSSFQMGIAQAGYARAAGELDDRDVRVIEAVEGVLHVAPDIFGFVEVSYLKQNRTLYMYGTNENWAKVRSSFNIESGRFLKRGDSGVVVLGNTIAKEAFDKEIFVGSNIKIEGESFRVIGILEKFGGFGSDEDQSVYLTLEDAEPYSGGFGVDNYYAIEVKVDAERAEEIAEKMKEKLMISRHVNEENIDFTVLTPKTIAEMVFSIMNTINLFLYGIAAISLVVGAVGIANTMFTSVTERTRQIGILKSLGMTNKEVMNLFLVESALIGLVGGILGLFVGFIISGTIGQIAAYFLRGAMFRTSFISITPGLIIFALAFSVIIGVISGIFPARRAAKLQPVEALRYE